MKKIIYLLWITCLFYSKANAQQKQGSAKGEIWFGPSNPVTVAKMQKLYGVGDSDAENIAEAKKLAAKFPKAKPYQFVGDTAEVILRNGNHHGFSVLQFNIRNKDFRINFNLDNFETSLIDKGKLIDSRKNIKDFGEEGLKIRIYLAPFKPEATYSDLSSLALSQDKKVYGQEFYPYYESVHLRFTKFNKTHVEGLLDVYLGEEENEMRATGGIRNLKFSIPVTDQQLSSMTAEDAGNMQADMMKQLEEMQKLLKKQKD